MISVCMATYNGEKYLRKQLESILKQLGECDEVIISDDMSEDKTLEIVRSFDDKRIKIVLHEENHGFTSNFENAIKRASGDYIFLADQDDEWCDNKVSIMLQYLKDYDFVVSDCITVNEIGEVLDESRFRKFKLKNSFWSVMIKNRFIGCCMAFNRSVLNAILPFPNRTDLVEHDTWIVSVALLRFKVKLIDEPLIKYCRHGDNASDGGFDKGYSLVNKIYRRLYRLKCLIEVNKRFRNK